MSSGLDTEQVKSAVPLADLSFIDTALDGDDAAVAAAVKRVRPADLGRDLSRRTVEESKRLFEALDDRHSAAMLRAAHPAVAGQLVATAAPDRAARVLAFLPTDHQVQILANVDVECRRKLEAAMDPGDKDTIDRLLAHDALAVGRLMSPKIWRADRASTVGAALDTLRTTRDEIEVAVNLYITEADRLVGVLALREVSIAPLDAKLADIMTPDPISVREDTPRGDAADIIRTHDFLSLPVVDAGGKLIGAIRVDDVLDAVLDKVGDGFLNQGGVAGKIAARKPYFQTPISSTVRSRLTWLILLFVAETATGTVLRYFEDELAKVVALSFFVPLLIGTGGNAGSQTIATVIRALALAEVRVKDVGRVVMREMTAGLILGVLLGTIAFGRALLWGVGYDLAFCVAITIVVVCTWANTVGAAIPIVAQRLGIDPTVISGPLITTLVDASGLFIYFTVAHLTIAALHDKPPVLAHYDCTVTENQIVLPACNPDKPAAPCWRIDEQPSDVGDRPRVRISIDRGTTPAPVSPQLVTSCAAAP